MASAPATELTCPKVCPSPSWAYSALLTQPFGAAAAMPAAKAGVDVSATPATVASAARLDLAIMCSPCAGSACGFRGRPQASVTRGLSHNRRPSRDQSRDTIASTPDEEQPE